MKNDKRSPIVGTKRNIKWILRKLGISLDEVQPETFKKIFYVEKITPRGSKIYGTNVPYEELEKNLKP